MTVGDGDPMADGSDFPVLARGISKIVPIRRNDDVVILRKGDFRARRGEMTAIVGPSGSGKSTLLYCLSGLERVSGGKVALLGRDITVMKPTGLTRFRREHLGFVFQSYNLVSSMTVEENLALPSTLRHRRFPRKRAGELLERFGLAGQRGEDVAHLSGGEQQRVALARVILADTDIIFADEPTGALDQETGRRVIEVLRGLARHGGRTVVMVTHDEDVAKGCDVIVEVRDGNILDDPGRGARR